MGLLDVLNGMQHGPRGSAQPSAPSSGGMSPMTMAIMALLAWKAVKHFSQPAPALACHLCAALIKTLSGTGDIESSLRAAAIDLYVSGGTIEPPAGIADLSSKTGDIPGTDPAALVTGLSPSPEAAEQVLTDLIAGQLIHTCFTASKAVSGKKKQIAHIYDNQGGQVIINDGALAALCGDKAASLLPIGVTRIEGEFQKGDIVRIATTRQYTVGYGIARYGSATARDKIGKKRQPVLIHYDHLHVDRNPLKEAV